MNSYLFIDGGYLRARFDECMRRYHGQGLVVQPVITEAVTALSAGWPVRAIDKVFYYDCIDERPRPDEAPAALADRLASQEEMFNGIRGIPGWHVREGRLVGSRKENRSQKRVDVLLAVEMLSHAFNKNMGTAILIAGDDDFTPLVDELLRHGTFVEVFCDRRSCSPHLFHAADAGRYLGYHFYWRLTPKSFRSAHPMPDNAGTKLAEGGRVLKFGSSPSGGSVKIVEVKGTYHFCTVGGDRYLSRVRANELRVLEEFVKEQFENSGLLPELWNEAAAGVAD